MSGYAKQEREFRIACEENLARSTAEKGRLADHRNSLIVEKDKLTAQGFDQTATLDDQILLYEILIAEQEDLCRELENLSEQDFSTKITELAERHIVIPPT
jgi:parvulin-like peptidyl-prolyl isomerase